MKRPEFEADVAKTQQIKPRLTPQDWVDALIQALLAEGPKGIRISRLARRLGVTPGSFYWHFRDRESLRDRALEHWRTTMLARVAATLERRSGPSERLRDLPDLLLEQRLPEVDAAMRAWAKEEPVVAVAVERADEMRIRLVKQMLETAGVEPEDAALRARMIFWNFLGSRGAEPELRIRGFKKLIEVLTPMA